MEKNSKLPRKVQLCQFCSNHRKVQLRKGHKRCYYKQPLHTEFCPDCDLIIQRRKNNSEEKQLRRQEGQKDDGLIIDPSGTTNRCCNLCKNHSEAVPMKGHKKHCKYNNEEHRQSCKLCENRYKHRHIMKKQVKGRRKVAADREARQLCANLDLGEKDATRMKLEHGSTTVSQGKQTANPEIGQLRRNHSQQAMLPCQQPVNPLVIGKPSPCSLQEIGQSKQPLLAASAAGPSPGLPTGATFLVPPSHLPLHSWPHGLAMPPLIPPSFHVSTTAAQEMCRMQQLMIEHQVLLQRHHLFSLLLDAALPSSGSGNTASVHSLRALEGLLLEEAQRELLLRGRFS